MLVHTPQIHMLTPSVAVFWDGASEEVIKLKGGHKGEALIQ